MNQFRSNQVYPAYGNPNYGPPPGPPIPQQQQQYQQQQYQQQQYQQQQYQHVSPNPSVGMVAAQPSYGYLPAPQVTVNLKVMMPGEEEGENPCGCCCGLEAAAKGMVLINLTMYVLHLGLYVYYWADGFDPSQKRMFKLPEVLVLIRECMRFDDEGTKTGVGILFYWLLILTLVITYVLDLVLSLCFANAAFTFCNPEIEQRIRYSSWYMGYHLSFPGTIYTVITVFAAATKYVACIRSAELWIVMILMLVIVVPFDYYDGMVAMAYRNALRRTRDQDPKEAMPMQTPSTGMMMGSGPGGPEMQPW